MELYQIIENEIVDLRFQVSELKSIYKDKYYSVLNGRFEIFFRNLRLLLWDKIISGICRLTDSYESNGFENASIYLLIKKFNLDSIYNIDSFAKNIKEKSSLIKKRRNKQISHNDYVTSNKNISYYPNIEEVDSILESLENIINIYRKQFDLGHFFILNSRKKIYDIDDLMNALS